MFFFALILLSPNSEALVVLKTKGRQVLIHLEGLKTKKGAYFTVVDLYGKNRGIVKIKRVAHTKAIGVLKGGYVTKRWSLEPISRSKAVAIQRKAKKREVRRLARIQKEKIKRKQAHKRRMKRKRLAQRKRVSGRGLASYDEERVKNLSEDSSEQYIMNDFSENSQGQSPEVLSYSSDKRNSSQVGIGDQDDYLDPDEVGGDSVEIISQEDSKPFIFGLAPRIEYNLMNVTPPRRRTGFLMHGLGYGLFAFSDFSLNNFIKAEGHLGVKRFSASADAGACGLRNGCAVSIYYLSSGLYVKLSVMDFSGHSFWLSGGGVLLLPLAYSNNILERISFSPFHGAVGGGVGFDFSFGESWVVPVSLKGHIYMPPYRYDHAGYPGVANGPGLQILIGCF